MLCKYNFLFNQRFFIFSHNFKLLIWQILVLKSFFFCFFGLVLLCRIKIICIFQEDLKISSFKIFIELNFAAAKHALLFMQELFRIRNLRNFFLRSKLLSTGWGDNLPYNQSLYLVHFIIQLS